MVTRRHVPFAGADKDPALLVRRNNEIPLFIFERIRCWNKSDRVGLVVGSRAPKNLSGFRSGGDASVCLRHNSHESRKLSRIIQLVSDLMEAGLFQCDRDRPFLLLAFSQRAFGRSKIAAKQKKDRTFLLNRVFRRAVKRSIGAGGECVKIDRRMAGCARTNWFVKILFE